MCSQSHRTFVKSIFQKFPFSKSRIYFKNTVLGTGTAVIWLCPLALLCSSVFIQGINERPYHRSEKAVEIICLEVLLKSGPQRNIKFGLCKSANG